MAPANERTDVERETRPAGSGPAPLVLVAVSAAIALLASMILSIESFDLAREHAALPDGVRPDSFPTPKSLLGVVWLPVVVTFGVAGLARARLSWWFAAVVAVVQLVGVVLAYVTMAQIMANGDGPSLWRWVLTLAATAALVGLAWIAVSAGGQAGLGQRGVASRLQGQAQPSCT